MTPMWTRWNIPEITPQELAARLKDDRKPFLLDVREQDEWNTVHIEGAVLAPTSLLGERGLDALPADWQKDAEIVVYCHHGSRSAQVTAWLLRNGYTDVRNLSGGIDGYAAATDSSLPRY